MIDRIQERHDDDGQDSSRSESSSRIEQTTIHTPLFLTHNQIQQMRTIHNAMQVCSAEKYDFWMVPYSFTEVLCAVAVYRGRNLT